LPSTLVGLVIAIAYLIPGFLYTIQLRRQLPQRSLTPLTEISSFVTISTLANSFAFGFFAVVRLSYSKHMPDLGLMLSQGTTYVAHRPGFVIGWALIFLLVACLFAIILSWIVIDSPLLTILAPAFADTSAWNQLFSEEVPPGHIPYAGCSLRDGSYLGGYVDWYSTEVVESGDRSLALAYPIVVIRSDGSKEENIQRLVVSASEIILLRVSYIEIPFVHIDSPWNRHLIRRSKKLAQRAKKLEQKGSDSIPTMPAPMIKTSSGQSLI